MSNMKELAPVTGAGHSLTAGCSKTTSKELVVHFGPTGKVDTSERMTQLCPRSIAQGLNHNNLKPCGYDFP